METEGNPIQNQNKLYLVMVGSCQGQKGCESRSELLGEFSVAPVPAWHTWSVAQKDFSGLMDKFDFPLLWSNVILEVLSEGKSHKSLYNIISLLFSSKPTQFKIQTNKNPLQNPGQLILSNQTTTFSTDNKFIQTFFCSIWKVCVSLWEIHLWCQMFVFKLPNYCLLYVMFLVFLLLL